MTLPAGTSVATPFVAYPDFFSARCVRSAGTAGLEVSAAPGAGDGRASPVNLDQLLLSGDLGTHVLDLQLVQGDLAALVAEKVAAFQP